MGIFAGASNDSGVVFAICVATSSETAESKQQYYMAIPCLPVIDCKMNDLE